MSTITPTDLSGPPPCWDWAPPPRSIYRLTVDQYEAMVSSGVFAERDRLHLIDGILVAKMTKKPSHVIACEKTHAALHGVVGAGWRVMSQAPVRLSEHSEPEPDVALARGTADDYADRHPGPADVPLIVEVADSSLRADRELDRIYGAAGVAVYWIVNLVDRQVEVYTGPRPDGYAFRTIYRPGQAIPVVLDGVEVGRVPVDDLLPRLPEARPTAGSDRPA
jgi:Uma2 family endonuclease